jgi:hypothetical protein
MLRGLVPTSPGVTVTVVVQDELGGFDPLFAARVHGLPLNASFASGEVNETVPAGFDAVPLVLSVTVTVMVLAWPTRTEVGLRVTLVEVARPVTISGDEPLLVACTLSVGVYVAVMFSGLVISSPGVTVAVHVAAFAPLFARVQLVNTRLSLVSVEVNAIVPAGLVFVPEVDVSVTVTVIVLAWPTLTDVGFRPTAVVVVRPAIVKDAEPLLVACTLSLGVYVAVMLRGLVPVSFGVTVAAQVAAFPPLGASVQVVKVSFASGEESAIVPAGFDWVPVPPSVTVTVIVLACPTTTDVGFRLTVAVVARVFTTWVRTEDVLVV